MGQGLELRSLQTFLLYYRETGTITKFNFEATKFKTTGFFCSLASFYVTYPWLKPHFSEISGLRFQKNEFINIYLFTCNAFIQCNCIQYRRWAQVAWGQQIPWFRRTVIDSYRYLSLFLNLAFDCLHPNNKTENLYTRILMLFLVLLWIYF